MQATKVVDVKVTVGENNRYFEVRCGQKLPIIQFLFQYKPIRGCFQHFYEIILGLISGNNPDIS